MNFRNKNWMNFQTFFFSFIQKAQLSSEELSKIEWILTPDFNVKLDRESSRLRSLNSSSSKNTVLIEIGPRLNFSTALSTNAVSICKNIGLDKKISRIEKSTIYLFEIEVEKRYLTFCLFKI